MVYIKSQKILLLVDSSSCAINFKLSWKNNNYNKLKRKIAKRIWHWVNVEKKLKTLLKVTF